MITLPLTIFWSRQTRLAAIVSPIVGMAAGLVVWLVTANHYGDGVLTVKTTGALLPCLWGTIASSFVPPILTVIITYAKPDKEPWDWSGFNKIKLVHHDDDSASTLVGGHGEKKAGHLESPSDEEQTVENRNLEEEDHALSIIPVAQVNYMQKASRFAAIWGVVLFLMVWILVPFALGGSRYIFSWRFFTGWVTVSIIWLFVTLLLVVFLPPIEGFGLILQVINGVRGKVSKTRGTGEVQEQRRGSDNSTAVGHGSTDNNKIAGQKSTEESPAGSL